MALALPASAHAADPPQTYVVPVCNTGSAPHPLAGWWFASTGTDGGKVDACATGGGFGMIGPTKLGAHGWQFDAPADVSIAGLRIWRSGAVDRTVAEYAAGAFTGAASVLLETGADLPRGTPVLREFGGFDHKSASFSFECRTNTLGCNPSTNYVTVSRLEMVLRDTSAPRPTGALTGTALTTGSVTGPVSLRTAFGDAGGGVREAAIEVDGVDLARASTDCSPPYASAAPCPRTGIAEVTLDARKLSDGAHRVALALIDVAGNRTLTAPFAIDVRNPRVIDAPPAGGPQPTAATRPGKLVAARATVRVRHDAAPKVSATLRDTAGVPIAGAQVAVATRRAVRGSRFTTGAPATTDARGRVTLKLPAGPSRLVRLTYGASVATIKVAVPASLRLSVTPKTARNQGAIRLSGSIPGTRARTRIELQAWAGGHWFPFRTVALRGGKFSGRYRFTRTARTTRYRFRAVLHTDVHFPYEAARSRVVTVLVRP